MTASEFRQKAKTFRDSFTSHLRYNLESPVRMQGEINRALAFLNSIETEGTAKEKIELSIDFLNKASQSARAFGKAMESDPRGYDLEARHPNPSFWYQKVIGMSESAMDVLISYLDGDD